MNLFLDQLNNIELYQRKEDIFTPIINSNIKQVQKNIRVKVKYYNGKRLGRKNTTVENSKTNSEIVELLLKYGADSNKLVNDSGKNPFHLAIEKEYLNYFWNIGLILISQEKPMVRTRYSLLQKFTIWNFFNYY